MRFRFSLKDWKNRKYKWHRWFAWRPVLADVCNHTWIWFRMVERQRVKDFDLGDWWDYREVETSGTYIARWSEQFKPVPREEPPVYEGDQGDQGKVEVEVIPPRDKVIPG